MGQILRRQIPVVNGLVGILAGKVEIQDIVDTLLSSVINIPLSAKQGKTLEDKKMEKVDVVNGLLSISGENPLSAGIGRELASIFESKVSSTSIENSLGSDDAERVLAAAQGKILHDMVSGRQDGMEYGGTLDLANASNLPAVDKGGFLYVVSVSGQLNGLSANTGDMIVSNGVTYIEHPEETDSETGDVITPAYTEYLASSWDIVDSSENPDILRVGDKQVTPAQVAKLAIGGIVKSLIDAMLEEVRAAKRYLVCDANKVIADDKFHIGSSPQDNCVIGDIVYVDMLNGTYDEWEGVSIDNQEVTLVGANGRYDGKKAKVSYFGVIPTAPVDVSIGYATDDKENRVFEVFVTGGAQPLSGGGTMNLETYTFLNKTGSDKEVFVTTVPAYPEGTVLKFVLSSATPSIDPVMFTVPANLEGAYIKLIDGLEGDAVEPRWYPAGTVFGSESSDDVDYLWRVGDANTYSIHDAFDASRVFATTDDGIHISENGVPFRDFKNNTVITVENQSTQDVYSGQTSGLSEYEVTVDTEEVSP